MRPIALLLALFLLAPAAVAQREVPGDEAPGGFLADDPRLPVSAEVQALSSAGRFARGAGPLRMLQNPALLADLDGLALAGARSPDVQSIGTIGLEGGALAYPLARPTAGRPLAVVLGAATTRYDYDFGPSRTTLEDDRVSTVALGVGWEGAVPVRAGVGVRTLTRAGALFSRDGAGTITETSYRSRASALDLSADVTLPVSDWVREAPASGPRLTFDVTAGATVRGLTLTRSSVATRDGQALAGGRPIDPDQTLTVGASARLALDVGPAAAPLRAVEVAGMADLVAFESDATFTALGVRMTVFEALALRAGAASYSAGYTPPTTVGLGVDAGGLLRAVGALTDDARLAALGRRVALRYDLASQPAEVPTTADAAPPEWRTHTLTLRLR